MQNRETLKNPNGWLVAEQPRLRTGGLAVLLIAASLASALALDMYTPAIPTMVGAFSTSEEMVNLTLLLYYAANAIGLLMFGTVSDKFGRKPVILSGSIVYLVGNMLCALSPSIGMLIAARVVAALGAGAVGAVGTAVVKDAIAPEHREKMLSLVQVMFVVGPAFAPVIGALALQALDWRGVFIVLSAVGALLMVLSLLFKETLPPAERTQDRIPATMGHLVDVCRHKGFTLYLLVVSMPEVAFMAYISLASYIYEEYFALGPLGYSVLFGAGAFLAAFGPILWLIAKRRFTARRFTSLILAVCLLVGFGEIFAGHVSPYVFCAFFVVFGLANGSIRPLSTNILLSQREGDAGAASSVINFAHNVIGCIGMLLVMLPWQSDILAVGSIMVLATVVAFAIWAYMLVKPVKVKGLID